VKAEKNAPFGRLEDPLHVPKRSLAGPLVILFAVFKKRAERGGSSPRARSGIAGLRYSDNKLGSPVARPESP
jgi:hypothetical protein